MIALKLPLSGISVKACSPRGHRFCAGIRGRNPLKRCRKCARVLPNIFESARGLWEDFREGLEESIRCAKANFQA